MTRWDAALVLLSSPLICMAAAVGVGCCIGAAIGEWREHR